MLRKEEINEFYQMIVASLEGTATDEQSAAIVEKIKQDNQAARLYVEILSIYANLSCPSLAESVFHQQKDEEKLSWKQPNKDDTTIWQSLLDMERVSPGVEIEKPKIIEAPAKKKKKSPTKSKPSRFWMFTAFISSAAMILLLISAYINIWFFPQEVATVTSGLEAQWKMEGTKIALGHRLLSKTPLCIQRGLAELTFDDGAKVIIEGPARFELLGRNRMRLHVGRLSALVSEQAKGFTVDTATSRVLDLGTEFGVEVSKHGETLVQMYEGKARLSLKSSTSQNKLINKGQANRVTAEGVGITAIPFEPKAFVTSSDFVSLRDEKLALDNSMSQHPALLMHLDASNATSMIDKSGGTVRSWIDISPSGSRYHAMLQKGSANFVPDALRPDMGAIDFGYPTLEREEAPTQMRLMTQQESKVFLDQTSPTTSGFTVALVVKAQSPAAETWCNLIGNTSVVDIPGFFMRWHILSGKPKAVAYLGGKNIRQDCEFVDRTVVVMSSYDRDTQTFSLWNSNTNETSRTTVLPQDFTVPNDTEMANDHDHDLHLGAFGKSKTRYFDGLVGEVRIYNQALDMNEQMSLKDELMNKWDVSSADL